jgi:alkylation response protein AidB-like acyl-CoA dehydrogenase
MDTLLLFNPNFPSQIAFLKSYATSSGQETARDAVQIFGGRGITVSGMGQYIEHVSDFNSSPRIHRI